jgi:hypothetical protein
MLQVSLTEYSSELGVTVFRTRILQKLHHPPKPVV